MGRAHGLRLISLLAESGVVGTTLLLCIASCWKVWVSAASCHVSCHANTGGNAAWWARMLKSSQARRGVSTAWAFLASQGETAVAATSAGFFLRVRWEAAEKLVHEDVTSVPPGGSKESRASIGSKRVTQIYLVEQLISQPPAGLAELAVS